MTYTLVLIRDEGKFDKWGCSLVHTVKKEQFSEDYSKLRLHQIGQAWMSEENIYPGEGYVHLYEDGDLVNPFFCGSL